MKKKFLTFLFAICFMLPCAFIMTACGENPPPEEPTLEGYTIFIKNEETSTFECVLGEKAIRPGDVVVVSKWSDETKNAIVPFNDFELSVSWYDWINEEEKSTFPDFWTNSTGYTNNDQVTSYWFKLTKDGVDATFNVNIKRATKTNPQVMINNGSYSVTTAEVEWAHNNRNQDNPTNCYSLEMSGLTEEDGYDENFGTYFAIKKEEYDDLTTIQEKKEFLDNVKNSVGACGDTSVFTNNYAPGTYYIFAYVYETFNYNYGEYGDGWIYNYATLTINEAEIIQTQQENVIDYEKDWNDNINFDWLDLSSELTNMSGFLAYGSIKQYQYIDGTWTVSETYSDTLKVHAIKNGDYYELVDLKNWQSSMEEWTVLNHDGTPAYDVDDNSKIELVDYTQLKNYIYYDGITLPIYYKVVETPDLYFDYSKIFKTEATINKYKLDFLPCVTPTAENARYGVIGKNQFEFTYDGGDFSYYIENAYYVESQYRYIEFQDHENTDYVEGGYVGKIVLKDPNLAWEWADGQYSSRPITFEYTINKYKISYPVYSSGDNDYTDYFDNYIELEWQEMNEHSTNYIANYIESSSGYIRIYRYVMEAGDELITDKAVMAEKIREHGVIVNDYENINNPENNVPGKVIIMYELENNNVTWEDEKTEPVFFKFEIVKADQNPRIESENGGTISSNGQVWIEISLSGTADLKTHILENTEDYASGYGYCGTDAPLVFELVDEIPDIATTTGGGTLENGVITVDGNAETSPLGTFCIKVTKAGNDCYNDFEMYVQVIVSGYSCDDVLSQYINSLSELDNYVTRDDGYEYEGLVFEASTSFAELNLPELPTTEYGKFEWFININSDNVKLTDGTVLSNGAHIRIMFTANDGKKWFIDDSYDGTIDGVSYTGYGLRIYMEQIN